MKGGVTRPPRHPAQVRVASLPVDSGLTPAIRLGSVSRPTVYAGASAAGPSRGPAAERAGHRGHRVALEPLVGVELDVHRSMRAPMSREP